MSDQIIDAEMARLIQIDAVRTHPLTGWVIFWDLPEYPEMFVARLITGTPAPYLLVAGALAQIHAQLPPGLVRMDRQPADPPGVVEIWFAAVRE